MGLKHETMIRFYQNGYLDIIEGSYIKLITDNNLEFKGIINSIDTYGFGSMFIGDAQIYFNEVKEIINYATISEV